MPTMLPEGDLMPYLNLDDKFCFHRKTVAAGNAAMGLWARCGSWSAGEKQDGFVPENIAKSVGKPAEIRRLVEVGLWERIDGGYQMHDYSDHNMTAAEWTELSRKRAEAGAKGGRRRPGLKALGREASA